MTEELTRDAEAFIERLQELRDQVQETTLEYQVHTVSDLQEMQALGTWLTDRGKEGYIIQHIQKASPQMPFLTVLMVRQNKPEGAQNGGFRMPEIRVGNDDR